MISIRPANLRDASWVTANMRAIDREETYCQLPEGFGNAQVAYWLVQQGGLIAYHGDDPVMVFGISPLSVCALSVWAVGTSRTRRVVPAVSRYMIDTLIPSWLDRGYNNMEARSLVTHGQAHRWMESMGGVKHGDAYLWGRNGEFFVTYRWTVASYRAISASRWSDAVPLERLKDA